ncbi:Dynamin-binding protein [Halotydeus destructor]|nr:Dynamin-binding protein [Halotydeus destructor]
MANFYGDRSDQQEIKALGQLHKAVIDEYWVDMKRQFNINIVQVLTMLVAKFTSPIYLIQKRQDKLLDYENAMKKASWEKDALRAKQFKDELAQAKNNYEALNTQLLDELPRLVELSSELFLNCLAAFFNIKKLFIGRCSKQLLSLMELPLSYSGAIDVGDIRQTFQVKHNLIADDMTRSFSIISKGALDGTSTLERNGSIRSSTSSDTSTFRRSMFIGKGSRDENSLPQSTNAREAILAKFRQADIFTATADFQATDVMDMSLRRGDWVGAIKRQDPMGNGQRWFVTNGVKQGFVPMKFLGSGNQSLGSDAFSAWDMS